MDDSNVVPITAGFEEVDIAHGDVEFLDDQEESAVLNDLEMVHVDPKESASTPVEIAFKVATNLTAKQTRSISEVHVSAETRGFAKKGIDVMMDNLSVRTIHLHRPGKWIDYPVVLDDAATVREYLDGKLADEMCKLLLCSTKQGNPIFRLMFMLSDDARLKKDSLVKLVDRTLRGANKCLQIQIDTLKKNAIAVDRATMHQTASSLRERMLNSERVGSISVHTTVAYTLERLREQGLTFSFVLHAEACHRADDFLDVTRIIPATVSPVHYDLLQDRISNSSVRDVALSLSENARRGDPWPIRRANCFVVIPSSVTDTACFFGLRDSKEVLKIALHANFPRKVQARSVAAEKTVRRVEIGRLFALGGHRQRMQILALEALKSQSLSHTTLHGVCGGVGDRFCSPENRMPVALPLTLNALYASRESTVSRILAKECFQNREENLYEMSEDEMGDRSRRKSGRKGIFATMHRDVPEDWDELSSSSAAASSSSGSVSPSLGFDDEDRQGEYGGKIMTDVCSVSKGMRIDASISIDVYWVIASMFTRMTSVIWLEETSHMMNRAHRASKVLYHTRGAPLKNGTQKSSLSNQQRWADIYVYNEWFLKNMGSGDASKKQVVPSGILRVPTDVPDQTARAISIKGSLGCARVLEGARALSTAVIVERAVKAVRNDIMSTPQSFDVILEDLNAVVTPEMLSDMLWKGENPVIPTGPWQVAAANAFKFMMEGVKICIRRPSAALCKPPH